MKNLGDKVKQLTTAVGIEPCEGCKRRAEKLNEWSRRGILKGGATAVLGVGLSARNSALKWLWAQVGASPPLSIKAALGFVRTFNSIEVVFKNLNSFYSPIRDVFLDPVHGIVTHVNAEKPGTPLYEWLSQIKLTETVDIFPGWQLDFALLPNATNATGYRLILASASDVLVTDENGVIYRAARPRKLPSAASLGAAKDFPDAVGWDKYPNPPLARRLLRYLYPTPVYAQQPCCGNPEGCPACFGGCCKCIQHCCGCGVDTCSCCYQGINCWNCFFNSGCDDGLPWIVQGTCTLPPHNCSCCSSCAYTYFGTYCLCLCCPK